MQRHEQTRARCYSHAALTRALEQRVGTLAGQDRAPNVQVASVCDASTQTRRIESVFGTGAGRRAAAGGGSADQLWLRSGSTRAQAQRTRDGSRGKAAGCQAGDASVTRRKHLVRLEPGRVRHRAACCVWPGGVCTHDGGARVARGGSSVRLCAPLQRQARCTPRERACVHAHTHAHTCPPSTRARRR